MRQLAILLLLLASTCCGAEWDLSEIVNKVDRLYRSESSTVEIEMTIETPHWQRTMTMSGWTRGLDDTFILIHSPKKDKGTATLRRNEEMWNYLPKVDRTVKVPPSMMRGSWMGSDFTNDDLVKETSLLRDYAAAWAKDPSDESDPFLYINLTPNEETVTVWSRVEIKVDRASIIPTEQRYFDDRGQLVRVMYMGEVKELGGKIIPTRLEMVPEGEEKRRTIVIYHKARFDVDLPDDIFTLRNLKKRR